MSKILIIVDMQNDFCLESGSLYVKGATPALWNIEELMYKEHFDPIQDLWKTEVYGLANYLQDHYKSKALEALRNDYKETCDNYKAMSCAIYNSCKLVPTDGLGISNSDLDQIGAKDYATVDDILSRFIPFENFRKSYDSAGQITHPHDEMAESDCWSQLCARHGEDVVNKVWSRHLASEFKRKKAPIYIPRKEYEND